MSDFLVVNIQDLIQQMQTTRSGVSKPHLKKRAPVQTSALIEIRLLF